MSPDELKCLYLLVDAWDAFVDLEIQHPDDVTEFRHKIHDLQRMIIARPQVRVMNATE